MESRNSDLKLMIELVGKEKHISQDIIIKTLESAMLSAARKNLGICADLEARYNRELGEIEVYEFKKIVKEILNPKTEITFDAARKLDSSLTEDSIGEDLGVRVNSDKFGRIAAQNAKQIIVQKVKEAERLTIYKEYKDRKDELITGTVRRFEKGNIIVDLGRSEAIIPAKEQVSKEDIRIGDRVTAYVLDVLEESKGFQIVLSRAHPNLVVKLFEQEVPEIMEGIVSIEAVSREAGFRSKIAVYSKDNDVDPVGACVGLKGARVQAVVLELRGEKIDITQFDRDEARFVCNSLAPAEITRVLINESEHAMLIIVPDEQLSLAIGRRGQNVRLAAELTGWKIEIMAESKAAKERENAHFTLSLIGGLTELQIQSLCNYGFKKASDIINADLNFLRNLPDMKEEQIEIIRQNARDLIVRKEIKLDRQYAKLLFDLEASTSDLKDLKLLDEDLVILNNVFYEDIVDIFLDTPEHMASLTNFSLKKSIDIFLMAKNYLSKQCKL